MDLLLPWYVEGTLSPREMEEVRRHLEECALCREELERISREAELIRGVEEGVEVPWTLGELDVETGSQGWWDRLKAWVAARPGDFLVGVALQTALCLVLAFLVFSSLHGKRYVTLSSPMVRGAQVVVVFHGKVREEEMRKVLLEVGATIVGGPSPQGAYKLGFSRPLTREELERVLEKLRTRPEVKFAARCGKG